MSPRIGRREKTAAARIAIVLAAIGVLLFALEGGEFGTFDLLQQRERKARLAAEIDSLDHVVDSLYQYKRRLETDPALQERIAREEFGMVRGSKEILYRFVEPPGEAGSGPATIRRNEAAAP